MKRPKIALIALAAIVAALALGAGMLGGETRQASADQHVDWIANYDPAPGAATQNIVFGAALPAIVNRTITVPAGGADVDIFARDCCIRDDTVEIRVGSCFVATVVSGPPGAFGTHAGETHTVSLQGGTYTVEYRNTVSSVGPSGWFVSETNNPLTGNFLCPGIDIKPSSFPNSINTKSMGKIPVAILGGPTIDVTTIDQSTVTFGPAGAAPMATKKSFEDVDGDGLLDLVLQFPQKATGIALGDLVACLRIGGALFACDSVRVVK